MKKNSNLPSDTRTFFVSRYLNIYPSCRNTSILFQGVTGAIDEVSYQLGDILSFHQTKGVPLSSESLQSRDIEHLLKRGHVTSLHPESELEDFSSFVKDLHSASSSLSQSYLMLIPSYSCNFRCPYCFQNSLRDQLPHQSLSVMPPEQVDFLFARTIPSFYGFQSDNLHVTLYGGEPFLNINLPTVERIIHYTRTREHTVSAITNAFMLEDFIHLFGEDRGLISMVQISIDGGPEFHDGSRIHRSGKKTFRKIISNVLRLAEIGVEIGLRVNVTQNNVDSLPELESLLLERGIIGHKNIAVYSRAVHPVHTPSKKDYFPTIFSQTSLTQRIEELGITSIGSPYTRTQTDMRSVFLSNGGIVLNRTSYCMQNRKQAIIIDPLSDIYGCYDEAGYRHRRIGVINKEGQIQFNKRYFMNQSRVVSNFEPCRSCSIALTCGGGCPVQAETANGTIFSHFCDSHKELVKKSIINLHARRMQSVSQPTTSHLSTLERNAPLI